MKKVLVTGITGQDGAFLANRLLDKGYEVYGAVRRGSTPKVGRLQRLGILDKINMVGLEITEFANVFSVLNELRPDIIYNLAAQSFVADSFKHPHLTSNINYMGVLNILEAIKITGIDCRLYQASTSEMYGDVTDKVLDENTPFRPLSPYAVAKAAAHHLVVNYRKAYNIQSSCGILFNHESELRGREFVTRKITSQIAEFSIGRDKPIQLGNMNSVRDWGYADDYVKGMMMITEEGEPDDFVLATNKITTVREFFLIAAEEAGFSPEFSGEGINEVCYCRKSNVKLCEVNSKFYRPSDVVYLRGSFDKVKKHRGWHPETSLEQMVVKMVKSDLDHVKQFGQIWDV